ncbi:hypothetical protein MVEN_00839100 [Mycena venus]|uniref:Lysine-specific metallo-endopeptidase domain-containing protein n=1 Tax=Mycena venus TaxID=2733690 RepID=A0A8H7D3D6_9AGAR|nr:hypothetical protein MVEN_00839100 [Mycena venus]
MFQVILNPRSKITITCPKVDPKKKDPNMACTLEDGTQPLAHTVTLAGASNLIRICPPFFTNPETMLNLNSKQFDASGWCTAPPHKIADFTVTAHTIIHEMTHLSSIAQQAGLAETPDAEGLVDVLDKPDENNGSMDTYAEPAQKAARVLREHWLAYSVEKARADKLGIPLTLKEPQLELPRMPKVMQLQRQNFSLKESAMVSDLILQM